MLGTLTSLPVGCSQPWSRNDAVLHPGLPGIWPLCVVYLPSFLFSLAEAGFLCLAIFFIVLSNYKSS